MEKKNYTVAVDLGCSSVVVAVGEKTPEGLLDVACVVTKPVEGVNAGRIENIELVSRAIREAVSEAEQQLGIRITEAYAGISGDFVRCARHTDHVFVYDPQNGVNQKDVDALFDRMRNVQAPDDETIMERVPQNYMVDDSQEVRNPVGSFGKKLSSTFNFILCLRTPIQRLEMALKRLGIKMLGVVPGALASSEAVLLPDEKEEGVAVVDIGGGTSDIAVISLSGVVESASIKVAGDQFNESVVKYMRRKHNILIGERTAEQMKMEIGCVYPKEEEATIEIKGRCLMTGLPKTITVNSTEMMEAFEEPVERILEAVHNVLERTPPELVADISNNGIVMTGGGSLVDGFDKLITARTGIHTVVAEDAITCVAEGTGKSLDSLGDMQDGTVNLSRRRQMN